MCHDVTIAFPANRIVAFEYQPSEIDFATYSFSSCVIMKPGGIDGLGVINQMRRNGVACVQ